MWCPLADTFRRIKGLRRAGTFMAGVHMYSILCKTRVFVHFVGQMKKDESPYCIEHLNYRIIHSGLGGPTFFRVQRRVILQSSTFNKLADA